MGFPYSEMEIASFMSCSKGYMGECGIRGGYAEVINMDSGVMAMLQKSISAKLCPTVIGQACMDVVDVVAFTAEVDTTLASYEERAKFVADTLNSIPVSVALTLIISIFNHVTISRESLVTQCREPCMHFPRSSSPRRLLRPLGRPDSPLMCFTHFIFLRPPASA